MILLTLSHYMPKQCKHTHTLHTKKHAHTSHLPHHLKTNNTKMLYKKLFLKGIHELFLLEWNISP